MSLFIMGALMNAFSWAGAGPVDTANTLPYVLLIEIIKNDGGTGYCIRTALSAIPWSSRPTARYLTT